HHANATQMLDAYGEPVASFLRRALEAFPPDAMRSWFARNGLRTIVQRDRIYPATENADDVLHCFLDRMRELAAPLALNCAVARLDRKENGFEAVTEGGFSIQADNVLIATGGVSYPKTGSVGDGQRMASELDLKVTPLRAGLAGVDSDAPWLRELRETADIPEVAVTLLEGEREVGRTAGNILCSPNGILRGSAIFDATRLAARQGLRNLRLLVDFAPGMGTQELQRRCAGLRGARETAGFLDKLGLPPAVSDALASTLRLPLSAEALKALPLPMVAVRPLKEAIVTVGGVDLPEIDPATMQARRIPGIYFAGEVMDVDGPTGGYNLHAAFATARLAVASVARSVSPQGRRELAPHSPAPRKPPHTNSSPASRQWKRPAKPESWYR
ncbi:MAG: aminoacetone oxidase family FAD-binding enzyme, partial [Victivallales bacterium]|nr:aminoacetone oxidase family FAD-binding enzyme [Victivallales bacterium]